MRDTSLRVLGCKLESHTPQIPPEDNVPRGCSLHSVEPSREWFCKEADHLQSMKLLCVSLKMNREERWTHLSLEGVNFPTTTVDVIQRRDLIIHFQQISRAAALYIRALLGGVKKDSRNLPKS